MIRDSVFPKQMATTEESAETVAAAAVRPVRIGTRRSNLAVVQAEGIRSSLQAIAPDRSFEIHALRTIGDKDQITALYEFGAKSLWTTELEEKLVAGELDVIVHCLKGGHQTLEVLFAVQVISSPKNLARQTCPLRSRTHVNLPAFRSMTIVVMP
jgi:hydroxymethylbilane synthase